MPPWLPHPSALLLRRDDGTWCCCCSHHSRSSLFLSPFTTSFPISHYAPSFLFFQLRDISTTSLRACYSLSCLSKGFFCPTRCIAPLLILTPLTPQALIGFICKSWFLVGHSITIVFHPSCAFFSTLLPLQNRRSSSRVQMFLLSLSSSRETDTTSSTSFSLFVLLRPESLSLRPPNISDASALLKRWRLTHQRDQNKQKEKFCVGYYFEIYNF